MDKGLFSLILIALPLVVLGYYPSRSTVAKFRSESVYGEFMKQWNTGVYFSLRYLNQLVDIPYFMSHSSVSVDSTIESNAELHNKQYGKYLMIK